MNGAASGEGDGFDPEDALPSTMTRKKALELKASLLKGVDNGARMQSVGKVEEEATFIAASYYPGKVIMLHSKLVDI